jgi:hypothetical protein
MRLLLNWLLSALALLLVSRFVPGFHVNGLLPALIAAVVIGLLNATLGLFLKIITIPFSILTLGIFLLVINGAMIRCPRLPCLRLRPSLLGRSRAGAAGHAHPRDRKGFVARGAYFDASGRVEPSPAPVGWPLELAFGRFKGFFTVLVRTASAFAGRLTLAGCGAAGPGSVNGVRIAPAPENPPAPGIRAGITITFAGWFCCSTRM